MTTLFLAVQAPDHGPALLHRLRSLGPPDMALFLFARNIFESKPIDVFNNGHHKPDFTFVEDICRGSPTSTTWCGTLDIGRQPPSKWV